MANIYFDASLQCGDHCYVGLPFVLKCKGLLLYLFLFFFFLLIILGVSVTLESPLGKKNQGDKNVTFFIDSRVQTPRAGAAGGHLGRRRGPAPEAAAAVEGAEGALGPPVSTTAKLASQLACGFGLSALTHLSRLIKCNP